MSLNSTLFTGLSGLNVNQTRLNVIGNNIANVNTVGFKSSRALFKPQFYITDAAGGPPGNDFGGSNPSQRGLGAEVSAIEKNFDPGTIETTGRSTDMAVDGLGFFIVKGAEQTYTRDGSFKLNSANQLVNASGSFVQGFGVDANNNVVTGALQNITVPLGTLTQAKATSQIKFEGNFNANGEVASGASILNSQPITSADGVTVPTGATALTDLRNPADLLTPLFTVGDTLTVNGTRGGRDLGPLTYTVQAGDTVDTLSAFFNQGLAIDTTVTPPAGAPTPGASIGAIAGDPAGTARLIISSNVGADNAISLAGNGFGTSAATIPFTFGEGQDTAGITSNPVGESVFTSFEAYDSLGTPLTINMTAVLEEKTDAGNVWRFYAYSPSDTDATTFDPVGNPGGRGQLIGTGTIAFDNSGRVSEVDSNTMTITRSETGAATPLAVAIDFNSMTSITDSRSVLTMTEQDGFKIGTLNGFSVGPDGTITGSFSNGQVRTLGQVALANFDNPGGLVDIGGNQYRAGANSGLPVIVGPLQLGAGSIRAGALEASNVDISEEFINLIIASTGFSSSSRVISASNQLMTELLQTTR